jgi:CRP-like cAMP-binding protein
MSADALAAPLLRVALFQGLKPLQLTEIARRAERIVFKDGDIITTEGTAGDAAMLIVTGVAQITGSGEQDTQTSRVEEGSLIGEMAMLIEHDYGATVRAAGQVRALKITRAQMHAHMLRDPSLAEHLTSLITERLYAATEELQRIDQLLDATSGWDNDRLNDDHAFVPVAGAGRALPAPMTH